MRKIFLCAALVSLLVLSTSCQTLSSHPKTAEEASREFLTDYFSFNKDDRGSKLLEKMPEVESEEDSQKLEKLYTETYPGISETATEDCVRVLMTNREPFKYDELMVKKGITASIDQIELEAYDETTFNFSVSMKGDDQVFKNPFNGQLLLEKGEDGAYKVKSFFMR